MDKLFIHADGGARGNPGPAAIGVSIKGENGKLVHKIARTIGQTTNNVAEYQAVIDALEWIRDSCQLSVVSCQFFLDSKLVVNQLNGLFKVKDSMLRNLLLKIRLLEQEVSGNIFYTQVPREQNFEADRLVNEALDGNGK